MLDYAAACRIYDASPPPWTDGEYAFPNVVPLNTDTEDITNSNLTVRQRVIRHTLTVTSSLRKSTISPL